MINSTYKMLMTTLLLILIVPSYAYAIEIPRQDGVSTDKIWKIKFNTAIDSKTLDGNITITDSDGKLFNTILNLSDDSKTVIVTPKIQYTSNKIYKITVNKNIKSLKGSSILEDATKIFSVKGDDEILANKYISNKNYNILSYDGEVDDYTLNKEMLSSETYNLPYIMEWSVQSVDPMDYIGKEIKVYKFTVNNHILDNVELNENKSTFVYVVICADKVIGGYSIPNYSEMVVGDGVYSIDGKTLEEVTGMSFPDWSYNWEKKFK